ncbi:MAG: zeta toxin family protein [Oscillospiraceae bacterium]|nr:zeta toxin family protein [Oscillospiraceae bacterium]
MINKLTGEPVSEEMQSVLKRLANGENVPEAEIGQLKEIREANSCLGNGVPTVKLKDREGIQNGVYNRLQKSGSAVTDDSGHVSLTGEIRREKRLDIVIGLPASGKSSALVEPISEMYHSRIIDSDEAKKLLPEYNDGWGAGIVHKESQLIADRQFKAALRNGENITYPRVGGDCDELTDIIAAVKKQGYSVYIHFNELDRNKALGRMINRFLETGRYIKPELVTKYGNGISATYETLKNRSELVDGFSKWNNDVPLGCRPKLIEYSGSCEDLATALKPTLTERLQQAETNCRVLRAKIDEVNDILRENPDLSQMYVQRRNEHRQSKGLTHKPKPPHK